MTVVVTGAGSAIAGVDILADLLGPPDPEASPVDPSARLGRRGLRYADRATQLALAAADGALRAADLLVGPVRPIPGEPALPARAELTVPATQIAVVASSNFGNVDTVCEVVSGVAEIGSTRLTSPMLAPRLSSNVVASEVAIRFGLRGVNLMLCNGPTSGLDAVLWARTALLAGRVRHVVVVGVEPGNARVRALTGQDRLLDGAAALVLETEATAIDRGAESLAVLGPYARTGSVAATLSRVAPAHDSPAVAAWFVGDDEPAPGDATRVDLSVRWGSASGALGVLQCIAAVAHFAAGGGSPVCAVTGSGRSDATAALLLHAPAGAAS